MSVPKIKTASGYVSILGGVGPAGVQGPQGPRGVSAVVPFSIGGVVAVYAYTLRLYVSEAATIQSVRASVGTPPTGSSIIVDVLKNGTTIFTGGTGRPTIAAGAYTALGTPAVTSLAAGDYLTISVVQVGSGTAGSDMTVQVEAH